MSQRQREWAEKAMEGEPLTAEHWIDLAEAALEKAAQLPCQDVLVLLSALDRQAEDLSVTLVLAARLTVLAPTMALEEILDAWQLLMRQPPAVRKKVTVMRALEELELSLRQCPLDATGLTQTLACLAAGGATRPELLQRLARQALELRDLGYQEMVAIETYFEALGGLQEPLDELLRQRKVLVLKEAPLPALLRALEAQPAAPLLEALVQRLEALGDDSCRDLGLQASCFFPGCLVRSHLRM